MQSCCNRNEWQLRICLMMVIFQATIKPRLLTGPSGACFLQSTVITSVVLTVFMIHTVHAPIQLHCLTFTVKQHFIKEDEIPIKLCGTSIRFTLQCVSTQVHEPAYSAYERGPLMLQKQGLSIPHMELPGIRGKPIP